MDDIELVYDNHILRLDGTMIEETATSVEGTLRIHVNLVRASVQPTKKGDRLEVHVGIGGSLDTPLVQDKVPGGAFQFQVPLSEGPALAAFFAEAQRRRLAPRGSSQPG